MIAGDGVVYFVRDGDAVKIGRSNSVVDRIRALECANSEPLEVLAIVPGNEEVERELHTRFQMLHIRGEWFRYETEIRDHVDELLRTGAGMAGLKKKRAYSREFTPRTERRIKFEIDRIPPTLWDKVQAKKKRDGVSLRSLILGWLKQWSEEP